MFHYFIIRNISIFLSVKYLKVILTWGELPMNTLKALLCVVNF